VVGNDRQERAETAGSDSESLGSQDELLAAAAAAAADRRRRRREPFMAALAAVRTTETHDR
jgi:hypothetical protein